MATTLACGVVFLAPARAETLARDAELYSRPSVKSDALTVLGAGMPVVVLDARQTAGRSSPRPVSGLCAQRRDRARHPWCTQGYPYSGSERYFQDGATPIHHGPLGFLFGYHVADPC